MDSMWCNAELKPSDAGSNDYSSAWVYSAATLHKKTDPTAEFADGYRAYESQRSSIAYKVTQCPASATRRTSSAGPTTAAART